MTTYESKIKTIRSTQKKIYQTLSDLNNLEQIKNRIANDKIKDFYFDTDTISINVNKVGTVTLTIIEREPFKTIKFSSNGSPAEAFLWIQLKEVADHDTKIKLTLKAKLNPMIKMMLKGKLDIFLNSLTDALTKLNYEA